MAAAQASFITFAFIKSLSFRLFSEASTKDKIGSAMYTQNNIGSDS
jgi:hypothetical protein